MKSKLLATALAMSCAWAVAQAEQIPAASAAASGTQFPQLPLVRPDAQQTSNFAIAWMGLLLIGGAALAFAWKRRVTAPVRTDRIVAVHSGRALTPQISLHTVDWEDERILVACTPQSVSVLARRPRTATPGQGEPR